MFDILIKGGLVLDGAANPGQYLSVGVKNNTIQLLRGDVSDIKATQTIDASGQVVTTELIGIDGNSYAPFYNNLDLKRMIQINSGLDGDPDIDYNWSTVTDYLDLFDKKVAVNIAYVVGNSPLRVGAMGWSANKANSKELDTQKGLLREAMQEGAFGMSTGLDYPPGNYADTD